MQIDVPKIKLQWGIIEFLIDAFVHDAIANNQRGDLQVALKNPHARARACIIPQENFQIHTSIC